MTTTLQAGCVAIGGRGLLILGDPGSGKSSLALALIDRGALLVGDDGVLLERRGEALIARPALLTRGLIEVRNLGILTLEPCEEIPVCLAITLNGDAPRFVEAAETIEVAGVAIPHLLLTPFDAILPVKAELALGRFGLPAA